MLHIEQPTGHPSTGGFLKSLWKSTRWLATASNRTGTLKTKRTPHFWIWILSLFLMFMQESVLAHIHIQQEITSDLKILSEFVKWHKFKLEWVSPVFGRHQLLKASMRMVSKWFYNKLENNWKWWTNSDACGSSQIRSIMLMPSVVVDSPEWERCCELTVAYWITVGRIWYMSPVCHHPMSEED